MSALATTDDLFFHRADATLDRAAAERITADALAGADDGELFLEYRESESISLEQGHIRAANYDTALGFGLRAVLGEETGYAHAGELSDAALKRAASTVSAVRGGRQGTAVPFAVPPADNTVPAESVHATPTRGFTRTPARSLMTGSPPVPPPCQRSTPMPAPRIRALPR